MLFCEQAALHAGPKPWGERDPAPWGDGDPDGTDTGTFSDAPGEESNKKPSTDGGTDNMRTD